MMMLITVLLSHLPRRNVMSFMDTLSVTKMKACFKDYFHRIFKQESVKESIIYQTFLFSNDILGLNILSPKAPGSHHCESPITVHPCKQVPFLIIHADQDYFFVILIFLIRILILLIIPIEFGHSCS